MKALRVVLAVVLFVPLALFSIDFLDWLPRSLSWLMRVQAVPALVAHSLFIILLLALLTLMFGRLYCSVLCPLGVFQDIINRLARRGRPNSGKKRRFRYVEPISWLRWTLLGVFLLSLIAHRQSNVAVTVLDPYSNFERMAVNLFRPIAVGINNFLELLFKMPFYHITLHTITIWSVIFAGVVFLGVGVTAALRGRLFCNTICPVGSLLGLLSRRALFRIAIDESKCTHCGRCTRRCKSECIDFKTAHIDASRCVVCFNCLDSCKESALGYRNTLLRRAAASAEEAATINAADGYVAATVLPARLSRRTFVAASIAATATLPAAGRILPAPAEPHSSKLTPITPPGSMALKHFTAHCTGCQLCVTHCPQQILKPAGLQFGVNYLFKPHLVFFETAFCNYECNKCSEICPNGAIEKISIEQKQTTQIGIARFERELCVVITEGTDCGACSEHCPTQAVRMETYKDTLRLPKVYAELCVGCGGCESICPVTPVKAINVVANSVHQPVQKPEEEETKEIEVNDFGF
ncbi:MAG: 4Fe-4S binding protein [Bacteroidales bacterium]|jgi:ferredoxin|nr:4Fe-4S binding protein [Bacteroidales bacterium]